MSRELLEPGCAYHVYNHAVGSDRLFRNEDNYLYFLRRFQAFIPPIASTYAYCLMSNHIHFLVNVNEKIDIPANSKYSPEQFVSKQFSNLFSSYTQALNKQQRRMGNLFISNFKRKKISDDEHLTTVIKYIHRNPVKHRAVKDLSTWKFSSYNAICSDAETFVAREEVLRWFGGVEEFRRCHELPES